jgi:hypothetical protein
MPATPEERKRDHDLFCSQVRDAIRLVEVRIVNGELDEYTGRERIAGLEGLLNNEKFEYNLEQLDGFGP